MDKKAITIKQPWAYLICAGIKDIENRTWKTKFRGRVYIHASASKDLDHTYWSMIVTNEQWKDMLKYHTELEWCKMEFAKSAIIGHVDIVDCVINHSSIWAEKSEIGQDEQTNEWIKPIYNWVLANPVLYEKPILDVKGKLSFWDCSTYLEGYEQ